MTWDAIIEIGRFERERKLKKTPQKTVTVYYTLATIGVTDLMGTKITKNGYLTVHDVTGPVSEVEMYDALERFYKQEPSALLLWDMSQADVSHVTSEILQKFVKKSAELEVSRQGGRTAVIASDDLQYGLAKMSVAFSEMELAPCSFHTFRTREEALQWLKPAEIC